MTVAEQVLWASLRRGNIGGHRFLRQHIIGDYIVDFLCRDNGLVIEVDGGYHDDLEQQESDQQRDEWLELQGYTVMRFTNEEVLNELDNVIETIENFFK